VSVRAAANSSLGVVEDSCWMLVGRKEKKSVGKVECQTFRHATRESAGWWRRAAASGIIRDRDRTVGFTLVMKLVMALG